MGDTVSGDHRLGVETPSVTVKASPEFLCKDFDMRSYEQPNVVGLNEVDIHTALGQDSPAHRRVLRPFFV